jgi:hypothetical protein
VYSLAGGTVTKLSGAMVSGGNIIRFGISPNSNAIVYQADQDTDGTDELYSVPIGDSTVTTLNSPLVNGGDIIRFEISANSSTVVYEVLPTITPTLEIIGLPRATITPKIIPTSPPIIA